MRKLTQGHTASKLGDLGPLDTNAPSPHCPEKQSPNSLFTNPSLSPRQWLWDPCSARVTIRKAASDSPFARSCLLPAFDAVIQGPENFPLWQWPLKATQNGQTRNSEQAGKSVLPLM